MFDLYDDKIVKSTEAVQFDFSQIQDRYSYNGTYIYISICELLDIAGAWYL